MGRKVQQSKVNGARAQTTAIAVQMAKESASPTATVPNRTGYPNPITTLSSTSTTYTGDEIDSDPDSSSHSDSYLDTDAETSVGGEPDIISCEESEVELDPEAEEILGDISRFREEGPAKPKHTPQTTRLWKTESEFWKKFCGKIQRQTELSAEDLLLRCDPSIFKSYLFWRKKTSRIKKESAIEAYWKRISMYYHDVAGHAMGNDILKDIRNWIPSLGLDKSKKEKLAMFVQDLYAIIHALWVDDTKPLHGFIRIQLSLLLLLSAATATRPGALVESASNKGSNKAVWFKDVQLMKVRSLKDPEKSTIVANVNLEHVKNKEKDGTPKKFTFRLEGLPALCIVLHILGIGNGRSAFRDDFTSIQQIFDLVIPVERNMLRIKWKKEVLDRPFFCDVTNTTVGGRILEEKAFPYAKYRDIFVRLGRVAGFEAPLELYQLRRASGSNINSAFTSAERNQAMGHAGDTYERYYTPTHIRRDFQAIYFGTPSDEELIRSVASMGLSRDRRAPTELNDDQRREVRDNPVLVTLRQKREKYKQKLLGQGCYPLSNAKGTRLHDKYEKKKKQIASTYQQLYRIRLTEAIHAFHESVDTIEIARQLHGKAAAEVLTLPPIEFELRERAAIAAMLFKTIRDDRTRVRFVYILGRLCQLQETRRPRALKRTRSDFVVLNSHESPPSKRKKTADSYGRYLPFRGTQVVKQQPDAPECEDIVEIESRHLYPVVLPHPVCGFCIGNEQFSYEQRMKPWLRKDVLNKHIDAHFRSTEYQKEFECPHPNCSSKLYDKMHFKRHSLDVHKVAH